jgi:cytochrome c biogenesis protein CcmG, thiol:disulfide interchange protein DsbE
LPTSIPGRPRRLACARWRAPGSCDPGDRDPWSWIDHPNGHLGLLVLDGLLSRNVTLLGRTTMELIGGGDVLRPWDDTDAQPSVPRSVGWTVHVPTRVALLDAHLARRRRLSPGVVAVLAGVVALIALLLYGVGAGRTGHALDDAIARGQRPAAPAVELPLLAGGAPAALADYRGKVVVLNYWASWCTPCRAEAPLLERWQRRIATHGATVLGIDSLDVTGDANAFVRKYRITFPVLRDRDGETQRRFGVTGYPETLVVDRQGRIAALRRGPVDDAFLRVAVLPLLKGSA